MELRQPADAGNESQPAASTADPTCPEPETTQSESYEPEPAVTHLPYGMGCDGPEREGSLFHPPTAPTAKYWVTPPDRLQPPSPLPFYLCSFCGHLNQTLRLVAVSTATSIVTPGNWNGDGKDDGGRLHAHGTVPMNTWEPHFEASGSEEEQGAGL